MESNGVSPWKSARQPHRKANAQQDPAHTPLKRAGWWTAPHMNALMICA